MLLPGKAGGTVAVRRTLACTICRIVDPTQVARPRQLRDASTVMRFRPAHQSMINRRFDDPASCLARKSPTQALACKPQIHSPASGNGGHESAPKGKFNDLCDTASAALIHMRDHGLLSLGEEFKRDERRKLVFRGRERRPSIGELYEGT